MKILLISFALFSSFVLFSPHPVFAASSYVLPYPSIMPGSKFYKIKVLIDRLAVYWYFGNFGQFTYNLKQSDKYLVEAKTLFEYKQYLFAYKALQKSTVYFKNTYPFLSAAKKEGKNTKEKELIFKNAAKRHLEVLNELLAKTPQEFMWRPEFSESVNLHINQSLHEAIDVRGLYE